MKLNMICTKISPRNKKI